MDFPGYTSLLVREFFTDDAMKRKVVATWMGPCGSHEMPVVRGLGWRKYGVSTKSAVVRPCDLCHFDVDNRVETVLSVQEFEGDGYTSSRSNYPARGTPPCYTYYCHAACHELVDFPHARDFIKQMRHQHAPTEQEKNRHLKWIRDSLVRLLCRRFAHVKVPLPEDIWVLIADYLLPVYSVALRQRMWPPERTRWRKNIVSGSLWFESVEFEGTEYVSSLSNEPNEHANALTGPVLKFPCRLFTAENYLGITKLLLAGPDGSPAVKGQPGVWWRCLPIERANQLIQGIKLRKIDLHGYNPISWSVPPPSRIRYEFFDESLQLSHGHLVNDDDIPAAMIHLTCNSPTATGYSVFWEDGPLVLHAHTASEDLSFYRSARSASINASWLYMPVDPDEYLTEIWLRRHAIKRFRAIAFRTNKGRIFIGGACCLKRNQRFLPFDLVQRLGPEPLRLFYEDSPSECRTLALTSDAPERFRARLPCPRPTTSFYHPTRAEDFFHSMHSLEGLEQVIPCVLNNRRGIAGLLLLFDNGRRKSVGQVRLDSLRPPISVADAPSWFLAFKRRSRVYPYVAAVGTSLEEIKWGNELVLEMACAGLLEWTWTYRQCFVTHMGRTSLEIYQVEIDVWGEEEEEEEEED